MDPRIREDDKSAELVRPFDKLRARVTEALARHSRVGGNPNRYTLQRMDPRLREDDKSAELVRPFDKLRDPITKAHNPKSKGANGAVAVGLPHGNCSVLKYARISKQKGHGRKTKNGSPHSRG